MNDTVTGNINIIEILKLGLPGLVFLLSAISYRLLAKEQDRDPPRETILIYIRTFMYFNLLFSVLTIVSVIIAKAFDPVIIERVFEHPLQEVNISLQFPQEAKFNDLRLVSGTYKYTQSSPKEDQARLTGSFVPTSPVAKYWQATIPYIAPVSGSKRIIILTLKDNHGDSWSGSVDTSFTSVNLEKSPTNSTSIQLPSIFTKSFFNIQLINSAFAKENPPCPSYPTTIRFNNGTRPTGEQYDGKDYYEWKVFVDENSSVLDCISEVQYVLHPTFPNPLQIRTNREDKFSLIKSGWGVFSIHIVVKLTNGQILESDFVLDFNRPWQ